MVLLEKEWLEAKLNYLCHSWHLIKYYILYHTYQILEPNVDYNENSYYINSKYVWINIMRMVITSKVKDVNLWLSYREERLLTISKFATNIWEYVESGGSNVTAITFDVIDEKQMYLALNDEMVKSEMLRHGVLPETILSFKQKV